MRKKRWPSPLPISPFVLLVQLVSAIVVRYCWRPLGSECRESDDDGGGDDSLNCDSIGDMVKGYVAWKRRERRVRRAKEAGVESCHYQLSLLLEIKQSLVANAGNASGAVKVCISFTHSCCAHARTHTHTHTHRHSLTDSLTHTR